jgi:hypothetical protein
MLMPGNLGRAGRELKRLRVRGNTIQDRIGDRKMSKYHRLVKEWGAEIAEAKELKAQYHKLVLRANAARSETEANDLYIQAEAVYQEYLSLIDEMDMFVQAEYYDVPFTKPRQAGIDGFWREAGLK